MTKIQKYFFPILIFTLQSCYSPKSEVEEDIHPEIPEFPSFSDESIKLLKVVELSLSQKDNCFYRIDGDYFFVFNTPGLDRSYNNANRFYVIKDGKLKVFEKWKTSSEINNLGFQDLNNDIYIANRRYLAPYYTTKKIVSVFSPNAIMGKYENQLHLGEQERDSAVFKKIKMEQRALQKDIFDKTSKIKLVTNETITGIFDYASADLNYLCYPKKGDTFYISASMFDDIQDDVHASKDAESNEKLYIENKSKIETIEYPLTRFGEKIRQDSAFFKINDKIVSGNEWFSTGNHYVASFGYYPLYLYYYEVKIGNTIATTKEDHSKIEVSKPIIAKNGRYFLVKNKKENKFQIYYLKN